MFTITQVSQRPSGISAVDLVVSVQGSVITINDEEFDFSFMEKESEFPRDGIESDHFAPNTPVICDANGVIHLSLIVPMPAEASYEEAFPPVLENKKYGKVIDVHLPAQVNPSIEIEETRDAAGQE